MDQRKFGWIKNALDVRDHKYKVPVQPLLLKSTLLPPKFDLRTLFKLPEPYNQGNLGSCTANAIGFAYHFDEIKQKNQDIFMPSRLFIYYNERVMENTVMQDSGAQIRDGMKSINNQGVCDEGIWKYDTSKFAVKPTQNCYDQAIQCKSISYSTVERTLQDLKTAVADGFPIVFGFTVYASFHSKQVTDLGIMPMPVDKEAVIGGHAVAIIGYDDTFNINGKLGAFIVRNSWGTSWGKGGYFYMPYDFILQNGWDFWILSKITNPDIIVVPVVPVVPDEPSSSFCSCFGSLFKK
jgi:C1A family cysteine protease